MLIQSNTAYSIPLADKSVQCVVTSPPYYGLRDYGTAQWIGGDSNCDHKVGRFEYPVNEKQKSNNGSAGHQAIGVCPKCGAVRKDKQIGLEQSPDEYVQKLVNVFREIRRVLKDDGTVWLNLGDSYSATRWSDTPSTTGISRSCSDIVSDRNTGLSPKNLIGIPWRVAFALQADGWYLRSDIIWHKPNPMPESVKDRPTKAHEYIFLLTKNAKYYYDNEAIKEETQAKVIEPRMKKEKREVYNGKYLNAGVKRTMSRNKRSVWTITTKSYKGAHFATFPPDLIEPCILAGSRVGDIILDPFVGSGVTVMVANKFGRYGVGLDLSYSYLKEQASVRIVKDKYLTK